MKTHNRSGKSTNNENERKTTFVFYAEHHKLFFVALKISCKI